MSNFIQIAVITNRRSVRLIESSIERAVNPTQAQYVVLRARTAHPEECIKTITDSDMVIADGAEADFTLGAYVSLSKQLKKPTLVMTEEDLSGRFISGVGDEHLLYVKQYKDGTELARHIARFIKQNAVPMRDLRFNLFINRRIYKYLRETSYETGRTKSEIIRSLLEQAAKDKK